MRLTKTTPHNANIWAVSCKTAAFAAISAVLAAFLFPAPDYAANPPSAPERLALEAFRPREDGTSAVLWRVEVELKREERQCLQEGVRLPDLRCGKIFSLLDKGALKEAKGEETAKAPAPPKDESWYRLGIGSRMLGVEFRAPRLCEVEKTGRIQCRDNTLTPREELLLELRALRDPG